VITFFLPYMHGRAIFKIHVLLHHAARHEVEEALKRSAGTDEEREVSARRRSNDLAGPSSTAHVAQCIARDKEEHSLKSRLKHELTLASKEKRSRKRRLISARNRDDESDSG
jgi:hypothetical protein